MHSMEQTPTTDRAVSLDEAISIAIQLQQNEQWAAADDVYRRILEVAPDHPDALHFSGVLAHQQGRSDEAIALIERSLELEPDRADWHSNLGHRPARSPASSTRRSPPTSGRLRSIRITPTRTTISACC